MTRLLQPPNPDHDHGVRVEWRVDGIRCMSEVARDCSRDEAIEVARRVWRQAMPITPSRVVVEWRHPRERWTEPTAVVNRDGSVVTVIR